MLNSSHSQPAYEVEWTHHGGKVLGLHVVSANLLRGGLLASLEGLRASRGHGAERDAGSTCEKDPGATNTGGEGARGNNHRRRIEQTGTSQSPTTRPATLIRFEWTSWNLNKVSMLLQQRHTRTPALTGKGHVTAGHVRGHAQAHLLDTSPSKNRPASQEACQGLAAAAGIGGGQNSFGLSSAHHAADRSRWGDRRHRRRVRAGWPGTCALCAASPDTSVAHALRARGAASPARSVASTGYLGASVARAQARAHLWRVRPGNGGAGDVQQ